jgi:hypothetical protein
MSAALLVECPGCGHEFAVRVQPLGGRSDDGQATATTSSVPRATARGTADEPPTRQLDDVQVSYTEGTGWEVRCIQHGWHAAREFPASNEAGAVIKCTGNSNGKWCELRVPLELARRRAGVTGR